MKFHITISILLLAPQILYGQGADGLAAEDGSGGPLGTFLRAATDFIFGPVLTFLIPLAFIVFVWGVIKYLITNAEDAKSAAQSIMFWGILGFVLIFALLGIAFLAEAYHTLAKIFTFIFGPVLTFLIPLAFIVLVWGVIKYFIANAEGDKSAAKSLMLWGVLGFVLIVALFGIVNLLAGTY